ncbi:prenyltransferase/squalene oxidase repeat-containing protein [Streptomyces sp. G-G2]|uniref:prenyltransferase/squalene oxidase repeat-containing protein n=1 Tax=Streptomyces sp. G-G2 TaxID=3046201 RepID=UPI0024B908B9|nr:prenyltransferase/squalene oxidase repeat-containing protein [Streptomyces sp. G-G2]MDJ0385891.1 terpene cyclase/mutase family protein [Streptomyces sp. G-G2]
MNVRRSAAALAASAVLCVGAAPAALGAPSPSPAPVIPSGLFGKGDPTYDGVWRQSFALLAQHTAGVKPAGQAVDWLTGQQCADGAFTAFRADTGAACDAKTVPDTNATAVAVQALKALGGHDAAVKKGADWLKSVQNEDGGWSYNPGAPSEGSSTSVVISALAVAGDDPAAVKSKAGKSAYDGLLSFQLGCAAQPAADRGAFGYQPQEGKLPPNADATAAAVLAALGKGTLVTPGAADSPAAALDCAARATAAMDPAAAAQGAAGYLAEALKADGHLTAKTPGADAPTADIGNTADAVIALAAAGHKQSAAGALEWLKGNSAEWSKGSPAALATLVLAAHATGADPRSFGGADLVTALSATGPAEQEKAKDSAADSSNEPASSTRNVWWIVGAGAAAGVGIGILLSGRRKKKQQL